MDQSVRTGDPTSLLFGFTGDDRIFGSSGIDFAYGGEGADFLNGQDGNDWLFVDAEDVAIGGEGIDVLQADRHLTFPSTDLPLVFDLANRAGAPAGYSDAPHGIEHMIGTEAGDTLYGTGEGTLIEGGDGNDHIHLYGGDVGYGGDGADTFYFYSGIDRPAGAPEGANASRGMLVPTIIDLQAEDKIFIDGVQFYGANYSGSVSTNGDGYIDELNLNVNSSINTISAPFFGTYDDIGPGLFPTYYVDGSGALTGYGSLSGAIPGDFGNTPFVINIVGFEPGDGQMTYELPYLLEEPAGGDLTVPMVIGNGTALYDGDGDLLTHFVHNRGLDHIGNAPSLHGEASQVGWQVELPAEFLERPELAGFFADETAFIEYGEFDSSVSPHYGEGYLAFSGPLLPDWRMVDNQAFIDRNDTELSMNSDTSWADQIAVDVIRRGFGSESAYIELAIA